MRGFFSIGIYRPMTEVNIGTLWRSAYQLGASEIFTVAERWPDKQASDTCKAWRHIPYRRFASVDDLIKHLPYASQLIGIEMDGEDIVDFKHPQQCCYLLGAEDDGLPASVIERCHGMVSLPSARERANSFNVSVAGSIVMWDRYCKQQWRNA